MKKKTQKKTCAGINSFSGGATAGIGARELLSASLPGSVWDGDLASKKLWSCDSLNKTKP